MSEIVQGALVALIVLAALLYVGRRAWATLRPRRADAGCDAGCGCGDAAPAEGGDWAKG